MTADLILLHTGFALLTASMLALKLMVARVFVAIAAAAWLARALVLGETAAIAWTAVLLAVTLYLIARALLERRGARFTADEQGMLNSLVSGLSQSRSRHLIDQGVWLTGKEGDVLTREGEPVGHLYYIAEGEARAMSSGKQVGLCRAGDLVGEVTVLSGELASATVILNGPARFWCAPAEDLRPYVDAHEDIKRAMEHGFAVALKAKLRATNRTIVEVGEASPAP